MSNQITQYLSCRVGLVLGLALSLCASAALAETEGEAVPAGQGVQIGRVFFAQHHVLEPQSPYFKLVGNLETLVKVQVESDQPVKAPYVFAVLKVGDRQRDLRLRGPDVLPEPYKGDPVLMPHRFEDSFTAIIPREWIRPGLEVAIELREYDYTEAMNYQRDTHESKAVKSIHVLARREMGELTIGAPNVLVMNMFDFHYFGLGKEADHPTGWEQEFAARLPISELVLHRVRGISLDKMVWQPFGGHPSMTCSSPEEYQQKTGLAIDGEQGMALRLGRALKRAGGQANGWRLYYINICGLPCGGQAGGMMGCGSIHRNGVMLHEVGHALGLPHWTANVKAYPYQSTMYGQTPGEPAVANAGPTWGFDLNRMSFLPAYRKTDAGYEWTRDPMMGGGRYEGPEYIYRHFSDYTMSRMNDYIEKNVVYWNDELGQYAKWNAQTRAYDAVVESGGLQFPIERDVDVISLLVTASLVVNDGSIVYAPIGPYKAGLIQLFQADSEADRAKMIQMGLGDKGYNVCLRVTQGGKVATYIMDLVLSSEDDPLKAFHVSAINLPSSDGEVTRAELLYCPDAIHQGTDEKPKVLYTWSK